MDIEQHGTGGVGIIGGMNLSAGQIPDEPSVNGSEKQIAAFCECFASGTFCKIQRIFVAEK